MDGAARPIVIGLFVGGRGSRMGGVAKGLLEAPGRAGTILDRLITMSRAVSSDVVLVGRHPAYASSALPCLEDAITDSGPLGGLVSLLEHAAGRDAIAIASDMPFVQPSLLARLIEGRLDAHLLAPRREGFWEPLFARYRSERVIQRARARLTARELSLQGLLDASSATELVLDDDERAQLIDWDSPSDRGR
ncbi:MAG: molybdenum cofactor guanylyltransferase [Deltaproteobacteria bacterium]|nr:molybdenum cofactor guanylyltransferase [Deltaproteobacteria bacterium]